MSQSRSHERSFVKIGKNDDLRYDRDVQILVAPNAAQKQARTAAVVSRAEMNRSKQNAYRSAPKLKIVKSAARVFE